MSVPFHTLMVQGTTSDAGKSTIVAALCRLIRRRGVSVAPFKPQNMALNSAVTADGGEIGRAQALQALACGVEPHTDMNPVLLKPESDIGAQVIVQGKRRATLKARDYARLKPELMRPVLESFARLKAQADLVIVEGAGSPAEVNLRRGDIANMGFAAAADVPVVLIGDIDRGGVIAQLVGTKAVLDPEDAARIKGFIVNRFRGDPSLFDDGYQMIAERTGWQGFGVLPWFARAALLPAEDALDLQPFGDGEARIACLALARIANFDDLDPLKMHPGVRLDMVRPGQPIPGDAAVVIVPGSKSTRADLAFLRAQGWDVDLRAHHRRGGRLLGICGGFQMLGRSIADPHGVEGEAGATEGLGYLDVETVLTSDKRLTRVDAIHVPSGLQVAGYEIHLGLTDGPDCLRPFARIGDVPEGARSGDGRVEGTYLHGLFTSDAFRAAWLHALGVSADDFRYGNEVDAVLDELALQIDRHLDVTGLLKLSR